MRCLNAQTAMTGRTRKFRSLKKYFIKYQDAREIFSKPFKDLLKGSRVIKGCSTFVFVFYHPAM